MKIMYDKTKFIYVGLDLHKEQHTAVIMDCFNEKQAEYRNGGSFLNIEIVSVFYAFILN